MCPLNLHFIISPEPLYDRQATWWSNQSPQDRTLKIMGTFIFAHTTKYAHQNVILMMTGVLRKRSSLRRQYTRMSRDLHDTLPATREFETHNSTASWKLGVRRIWIRMGPRSYKFRIVVLPAEYVIFAENKSACGSWDDLPKPDICQKISDTPFWPKTITSAAAGKTSPNLLHVQKS